ncbi:MULTISPECIES: deoxyribose-phosphate aldolase [Rhizobium]|jgi:deoxyribose-phosphate aldolase|uniref:Deoxyribose-phosphate aldolase n=1 Tax=Rhizobium leguminosarum bv. trifolii (strain WSM1325) TaxID=395491 RepID=C6B298_RHILS|nr:deoxyribose-phosphate aldolase [Rhizobium leguminosarum]ACS58702.1 deoxyribose-phosphate aldolase [Rhizobium leguminosarum bv. trifolii WSM1325]MBY2932590.1 deoxyribose-phosphate aldolase [Rhizobium leguminosarum]MBY2940374.1 deoxyribose-phosphate aldolase [Rhizobium leguminosarum]MBY3031920.1 deoxyribose-phosphate aldolase [Rhizobium leguminosarum]RWY78190.1 deoxyribose-phosphate aldolase [Rhizobium leguminosarum]
MNSHSNRETAAVALSLLDLTNLRDDCTEAQIDALCARAQTPYGTSAAICIWPRFVAQARNILGTGHAVRIATVVNLPSGDMEVADVAAEAREAIADGADEIDLVIPYRKLLAGNEKAVTDMVKAVRAECAGPVLLKVIIETGELKDAALIRRASELAIEAGADFIKTSTGKVAVNATLEAADIMIRAIRESGRKVGFKPAGGIGSLSDAALYLSLAETIMTPDWAMPSTFRFGASDLLDDILAVLSGTQSAPAAASSY